MEKNECEMPAWECNSEIGRPDAHRGDNETNVSVHEPGGQLGLAQSGDSNVRKCNIKHFVDESTLRNVNLDELEELSDAGCNAGIDGDIRRTSSSASSERAAVKFAVVLGWDNAYFQKPHGLLRLALLACIVISLVCLVSAGTSEVDVLELPVSCYIRIHIFACIFTILVSSALFFLDVTFLIQSLPTQWNFIDAFICGCLSILCISSSSMLLHAENVYQKHEMPIATWTRVQISLAAVFGFLSTLVCVFLSVSRWCSQTPSQTPEDIVLTSIRTS